MRPLALLILAFISPLALAQDPGETLRAAPKVSEIRPLTEEQIAEHVRLRVIVIDVLRATEAELGPLDNDENGPLAKERVAARLAQEGWDYSAFQARGDRILNAIGAIALEAEMAEATSELEEMLAEMGDFLTADQVAEMRSGMAAQDEEAQALIDTTRPDWPAVQAFAETLDHLHAYAARNRPDPPVLATDR